MKKIIVVDDELLLRDVMYDYLTSQGYDVVLAADADKALEMVEAHVPHIALIDIKLPNMSGIELTRIIKQNYPNMYIIIMTGYPSLDTAATAMKSGASEYIIKPFRLDELNKIIKKYLML